MFGNRCMHPGRIGAGNGLALGFGQQGLDRFIQRLQHAVRAALRNGGVKAKIGFNIGQKIASFQNRSISSVATRKAARAAVPIAEAAFSTIWHSSMTRVSNTSAMAKLSE